MVRRRFLSSLEILESRIAPAALTVVNPLADIVAGIHETSAKIDLGTSFSDDTAASFRTHVEFDLNIDSDPVKAGMQPTKVILELFDDKAPLTVADFLSYVNSAITTGDYDNTFFHRSVNQPATSNSGNLQILQAGGFDVSDVAKHITVGPDVHNEYNANDPERANTTGTIALAKTAVGPNTGTSEFYFNMGDNSTTLDGDNNGGFTVFGKVVQGFDALQSIFARPTTNEATATKNSALTDVPYKPGYDSNPDQNLITPSPAMLTSQYYKIISAEVVPPPNETVSGISYTIVSEKVHGTTTDSTLVGLKLTGDTLKLAYPTTKSGLVDITVRAEEAGFDPVDQTFSVLVAPNLTIHSAGDTLNTYIGPGDTGVAKAKITNNGAATLSGGYTITYFLSLFQSTSEAGRTFDAADVALGALGSVTKNLNLASGESLTIPVDISIPKTLQTTQDGVYRLIAVATPVAAGSTLPVPATELYSDDNAMRDGGAHQFSNIFGKLKSGKQTLRDDSSITWTSQGEDYTATIKNGGYGLVSVNNGAYNLELFNTTSKTNVTVTAVDHTTGLPSTHLSLANVIVHDANTNGTAVGNLNLGAVDLTGSFFATGGVSRLTLGNMIEEGAEHFLDFGVTADNLAKRPAITLGDLNDTIIFSTQLLGAMKVNSWVNDNTDSTSLIAGLQSLTVAGNMQANLEVNQIDGDGDLVTLSPAKTIAMTLFKVGKTLTDSMVKLQGNVTAIDLGAIDSSTLLVGADTVPGDTSSFSPKRTVGTLTLHGNVPSVDFALRDSDIAASTFTKVNILGTINTADGFDSFGLVADTIVSYARAGKAPLKNLTAPAPGGRYDVDGLYGVTVL